MAKNRKNFHNDRKQRLDNKPAYQLLNHTYKKSCVAVEHFSTQRTANMIKFTITDPGKRRKMANVGLGCTCGNNIRGSSSRMGSSQTMLWEKVGGNVHGQ